ncbi:MAG TPA: DUF4019 domain-containing protein [Candidatus Binataceae bacterium]|nr:DUF4019 domain-containing protein [Candidatus Binataceae bacterium]
MEPDTARPDAPPPPSFSGDVAAGHAATWAFAAMVAVLVAVRVGFWATSATIPFNDTWDYWNNARFFRDLNFANYDGVRAPAYPLLVLACGLDGNIVRIVQHTMGVAIASMLFWIVYRSARSWPLAFTTGLLYGLSLRPLVYESTLLSETLCTFLLMLAVAIFARMAFDGKIGRVHHALLGAAIALTTLCRPMYLFIAPLFFVLLITEDRSRDVDSRETIRRLALFAAFSVIPMLGWCAFNLKTVGYFGLSTQLGFDLTDHCVPFIELAPARYALIRDHVIPVRNDMIAATGTSEYAGFRALWSPVPSYYVPMSRELARMAFQMIVEHPILYGETVVHSLRGFWTGVPAQRPVAFGNPVLAAWIWSAWRMEQLLLAIPNIAFFIFAALALSQLIQGKRTPRFALAIMSIVIGASLISSMVEYEENNRMYSPSYPLVLYFVIVSAWRYIPATFRTSKWKWIPVPIFVLLLIVAVAGYHSWEQTLESPAISAADDWLKAIDECAAHRCWEPPNDHAERFRDVVGATTLNRKTAGRLQSRRFKLARYDTELTFRPPARYVYVEFDSTFEKAGSVQEIVLAMQGNNGQWSTVGYSVAPLDQYFSGGITLPRQW